MKRALRLLLRLGGLAALTGFALDLSPYTQNAGTTTDANKLDNAYTAIQNFVNALPIANLGGFPNDASKLLRGDGTWTNTLTGNFTARNGAGTSVLIGDDGATRAAVVLGGDTNLYRSAGAFIATDGDLGVRNAAATTGRLFAGTLANGNIGFLFGGDTNLYRNGGLLQGDQAFVLKHATAATPAFATLITSADANYMWMVQRDGKIQWGAGGANALDTNLYRSAADTLKTDDNLIVSGQISTLFALGVIGIDQSGFDVAGRVAHQIRIGSEANPRYAVKADGSLNWGLGGANATDTNLYRSAAGVLDTDGDLRAQATGVLLKIGKPTGINAAGIQFGADVNLYRSAADRLITDDLFDATALALATKQKAGAPVDGDWAVAPPNGTLVVDSTNNKIWARVGGVWKGVVIA